MSGSVYDGRRDEPPYQAPCQRDYGECDKMEAALAAALERERRLVEALDGFRYGHHAHNCPIVEDVEGVCNCGWERAQEVMVVALSPTAGQGRLSPGAHAKAVEDAVAAETERCEAELFGTLIDCAGISGVVRQRIREAFQIAVRARSPKPAPTGKEGE